MSNRRRPKGLREALAAKKVRESHYDVPVADSDEADAAGNLLSETRQLLRATRLTAARAPEDADVAAAVAEAEKQLADAEKAYEKCFYRVKFRGLSAADFNALQNEHAPAEEAEEDDANDAFFYALMEACAVDSDLTAEDWKAELDSERWSAPDRHTIKQRALEPNLREFSAGIPKD